MSKLELIYTVAISVVVLFLVIYYIILAIKNGWIKKITDTLNTAIRYAEANIKGGAEKKKYVLKQVEDKCVELGIPYGLIKNLINQIITKVIANYNIIDHDGK